MHQAEYRSHSHMCAFALFIVVESLIWNLWYMTNTIAKKRTWKSENGIRTAEERERESGSLLHIVLTGFRLQLTSSLFRSFSFPFFSAFVYEYIRIHICLRVLLYISTFTCGIPIFSPLQPSMNVYFRTHQQYFFCAVLFYFALNCIQLCWFKLWHFYYNIEYCLMQKPRHNKQWWM